MRSSGYKTLAARAGCPALEAAHAYFLSRGIPEAELPATDRGWRFLVGRHMESGMRKEFNNMRQTFHVDGYYGGIVDFDLMPMHLDELDEFIETVAGRPDV